MRLSTTVWGHVRYRSDDCSARCYSLCVRGRMVFERGFRDCRYQGLVVTRGSPHQLYPVTVSRTGHTNEYVHNVASRVTWCTGGAV